MSANSATGSAVTSVQKLIIEVDVKNLLRSGALKIRLKDRSLSVGSIELSLRCPNLITIGWGVIKPFDQCRSLLRVDLSCCPKLESIPELVFFNCSHLVEVVFRKHSSIANIGSGAFGGCSTLKSITSPIGSKS